MGKNINKDIKYKIIQDLESGLTFNDIIEKHEVKSKSTLTRWCKELNIQYDYVPKCKHDYQLIKKLYESGKTIKEICSDLNISIGNYNTIYKKLYLKFRPDQGNIRYFEKIDSPQKAYILGFIAADGYIVNNTFGIQINICDIDVLNLIRNEIGSEKNITYPNEKMCRFTLTNKLLVQDLYNLGITPRKSKTLENIIKNIPKKLHPDFISGYFDGDGCVVLNKKPERTNISISFRGTKEFLEGFINTMELSNYYFNFYKTWVLSFSKKEEVYKFYTLYKSSCFKLSRKINKFNEGINKLILKYPQVQTISSPLLEYKK